MYKFLRYYLPFIALLVGLDQLSKYWARAELSGRDPFVLTPLLELELRYNRGAAFSLLNEGYWWQYLFLVATSIVLSVVLVVWLMRLSAQYHWRAFGLQLLLAGALGNLIDRALFGAVTDFISVHWDIYYFPTFNMADSMITVGVTIVLLDTWCEWSPS